MRLSTFGSRKLGPVVATGLAMVGFTACGVTTSADVAQDTTGGAGGCVKADVSPLRQVEFDYEPALSPPTFSESDPGVAISGTVDGFGGSFESSAYLGSPRQFTTMRIRVDHLITAGSSAQTSVGDIRSGEVVYAPVFQGPLDSSTGRPVTSAEDFNASIPNGTPVVMVVGEPSAALTKDFAQSKTAPSGTTPVGVGPQTIYLQTCDGIVGGMDSIPATEGWSRISTLDELEAAMTGAKS